MLQQTTHALKIGMRGQRNKGYYINQSSDGPGIDPSPKSDRAAPPNQTSAVYGVSEWPA